MVLDILEQVTDLWYCTVLYSTVPVPCTVYSIYSVGRSMLNTVFSARARGARREAMVLEQVTDLWYCTVLYSTRAVYSI